MEFPLNQLDGSYTIQDFQTLNRGDTITIHRASDNCPQITWIHDRVAYDCIWGAIRLPDGTTLPTNAYLYDNGHAVHFADGFGYRSEDRTAWIGFPGGFKLCSYAYQRPPLLSQYPKRWNPDDAKRSRFLRFNGAEEKTIQAFVQHYRDLGFTFDGHGFAPWEYLRVPLLPGHADFALHKGQMSVHIRVAKCPAGIFRTAWYASLSDGSRRPINKQPDAADVRPGLTHIITQDTLPNLASALAVIENAVDLVSERNRTAELAEAHEVSSPHAFSPPSQEGSAP